MVVATGSGALPSARAYRQGFLLIREKSGVFVGSKQSLRVGYQEMQEHSKCDCFSPNTCIDYIDLKEN